MANARRSISDLQLLFCSRCGLQAPLDTPGACANCGYTTFRVVDPLDPDLGDLGDLAALLAALDALDRVAASASRSTPAAQPGGACSSAQSFIDRLRGGYHA